MTRTTRAAVGAVIAATAASLCCLGPIVFALVGAGALGAAATRWAPYRPVFLGLAAVLLGVAFYWTYRPRRDVCATDGACPTPSSRTAKIVLWIVTGIVILLAAFPYYVGWLV